MMAWRENAAVYRILFGVGAALSPLVTLCWYYIHPQYVNSLWIGWVVGGVSLAILAFSYFNHFVKSHLQTFFVVLLFFSGISALVHTAININETAYMILLLFIISALSIFVKKWTWTLAIYAFYFVLMVIHSILLPLSPGKWVPNAIVIALFMLISLSRVLIDRDRGKAKRESEELQDMIQTVFATANDGILVTDLETTKFTMGNPRICRMLGYSQEELMRFSVSDILPEKDLPVVLETFDRLLNKDIQIAENLWVKRKDGSLFYTDISGSRARVDGKDYMIGIFRDITARMESEQALRESENRFRTYIELSPVAIFTTDSQGRYLYTNPEAGKMLGYSESEFLSLTILELAWPDEVEEAAKNFRNVGETGYNESEIRLKSKDGNPVWVNIRAVKLSENRFIAFVSDISLRHRMDEMRQEMVKKLDQEVKTAVAEIREKDQLLIQSSRLAMMGEMINNITHQWRQPINILGMLLQNLEAAWSKSKLTREYMEDRISKGMNLIQIMSRTIDDFRNFYNPDKEKVHFMLSSCLEMAQRFSIVAEKNEKVRVETSIRSDLELFGYPGELGQVFVNLLNNSHDAFLERNRDRLLISLSAESEGSRIVLVYRDDAGGIPDDVIGKVFDPYFTTKKEGTGLGMYMSRMIIEKSFGGEITASNSDRGALFRISFPGLPAI